MRIGISTLMIQRGQTGIAQYLFALIRALLPRCHEHQFFLYILRDDLPLFSFARSAMELEPVPERFRSPMANLLWHHARLPHLARAHRLDVLHVPSYRRLLWTKPCPLVATIHDLAPFHVAGKYDWKRMLYGRVVARRLARRQDRVIAVSGQTARDIGKFYGLDPRKVRVIHNGLDHERFLPGSQSQAKERAAERYGLRRPFFLYVARLEHPAKNHVRLIEAFDAFKSETGSNWEMVFGGGDWHGVEAIRAAVRQSAFSSQVRLLGFVTDEDLPGLYQAADAFVYPSLYEGFGMPPAEAMACGCPVICSNRGALQEVVGGAAAIVDPEDIGSMSRQLAALAKSAGLRETLRSAGLAQSAKFDWRRTAGETLEVYQCAALGAPEPVEPGVRRGYATPL